MCECVHASVSVCVYVCVLMPSGAKCVIRCSPAVADVKREPAQGTQGHRVARETTTAVALSHTQKHAHFLTLSLKDSSFISMLLLMRPETFYSLSSSP